MDEKYLDIPVVDVLFFPCLGSSSWESGVSEFRESISVTDAWLQSSPLPGLRDGEELLSCPEDDWSPFPRLKSTGGKLGVLMEDVVVGGKKGAKKGSPERWGRCDKRSGREDKPEGKGVVCGRKSGKFANDRPLAWVNRAPEWVDTMLEGADVMATGGGGNKRSVEKDLDTNSVNCSITRD